MIALALADGTIKEEEKQALTKICADINISKEGCIELLNAQTKPDLSIFSATKGVSQFSRWVRGRF